MLYSYEQELCFRHLRKQQFSQGRKKIKNQNHHPALNKKNQTNIPLVMGGSKFAKVFFSGLQQIKNRNPRHQCVLWSEEIIWIWCFYCTWLKSRTWTGASCLLLEHPKHQPTALFRMGSFVWNAKGKGNRNSSFHKYLEQSLEPSPAGLWIGEKMLESPFSFSTLCDLCSKAKARQRRCHSCVCLPLSWTWRMVFSKLGGVGMIFKILLFCCRHIISTSWVDWTNQWAICSGIWLASSASLSRGYLPIKF